MGLTGKYDFKGIKKFGAKGILLALDGLPYVGAALRWGLRKPAEILVEGLVNWLANQGLIVLNVGAIAVKGEWDQKAFDSALEKGLAEAELNKGKLTPAQAKAIDDAVIEAARDFIVITRGSDRLPDDANF